MSVDGIIESLPPAALREAVAALWRIRPPGPGNLFNSPEFHRLHDCCAQLYPKAYSVESSVHMDFALSDALQALGLPARLSPATRHLVFRAGVAAAHLHAAFEQRQARRGFLCPLDRADEFPALPFGPNRIARFTTSDLEELVDQSRLRRANPTQTFDTKRFSEFMWLVIEQIYSLDRTPAERGQIGYLLEPFVSHPPIDPHQNRYPPAVEIALFAMRLAPWEDWKFYAWGSSGDWRCFRVPWVYEINDDLFVPPSPPPSPDSLSWTDPDFDDEEGVVFGTEQPQRWAAKKSGSELPEWLNGARWVDVIRALESPLFDAPIAHFFPKGISGGSVGRVPLVSLDY